MTTKSCSQCGTYFIGLESELICPKCENQTELPKASRKRGDKEKFISFDKLFDAWKKLRKEREQWRKCEGELAQAMMDRERLEMNKRMLLIALEAVGAFDADQDLLRQFVNTKNQLNVMTAERDRFKESSNNSIRRLVELQKENGELAIENMRLRYTRFDTPKKSPSFTKEMWRRFTQLCHPDKHDGSVAANEATRWLLENRP